MPFTNRRLVLALLLTVILAGACSESGTNPPPPPPGPGALAGSIYQRLNPELPLEGAELSWGGASAQSGADGSYTLSPDATGSDSLRVSLDGFVGESRWVTLGEDDQQHSFTLLPYDTVPPPAPLAFGAATEDGQFLRLTWTAPADSSDLAGYWLTKSPGDPQAQRFDISVNSWLDLGVSFGRDYSYRLSSVDASGNLSAPLEVVDAVNAPPVPSFLEFLPTGDYGHVNLRWNANDEDDFAFYRLYRRDGGLSADSLNTLVYSTANAGDTLFTDTGVVANALYTYRLYTVDSAGTASTQPSQSQARGAAQRQMAEILEAMRDHAIDQTPGQRPQGQHDQSWSHTAGDGTEAQRLGAAKNVLDGHGQRAAHGGGQAPAPAIQTQPARSGQRIGYGGRQLLVNATEAQMGVTQAQLPMLAEFDPRLPLCPGADETAIDAAQVNQFHRVRGANLGVMGAGIDIIQHQIIVQCPANAKGQLLHPHPFADVAGAIDDFHHSERTHGCTCTMLSAKRRAKASPCSRSTPVRISVDCSACSA